MYIYICCRCTPPQECIHIYNQAGLSGWLLAMRNGQHLLGGEAFSIADS